jgi:hypothetical protein
MDFKRQVTMLFMFVVCKNLSLFQCRQSAFWVTLKANFSVEVLFTADGVSRDTPDCQLIFLEVSLTVNNLLELPATVDCCPIVDSQQDGLCPPSKGSNKWAAWGGSLVSTRRGSDKRLGAAGSVKDFS